MTAWVSEEYLKIFFEGEEVSSVEVGEVSPEGHAKLEHFSHVGLDVVHDFLGLDDFLDEVVPGKPARTACCRPR